MHFLKQHWYVPRNASTLVNVVTWPVIPDMTLPVQVTCAPVKWAAVAVDMDTQVILKHDFFSFYSIAFKTKLLNSLDVFCFVQTLYPIQYRHMDIAFICIFKLYHKIHFEFPFNVQFGKNILIGGPYS